MQYICKLLKNFSEGYADIPKGEKKDKRENDGVENVFVTYWTN